MYKVETYTIENGSNMDAIEYKSIPVRFIAKDLMDYDNWDYATVSEEDKIIADIFKIGDSVEIITKDDRIVITK